VLSNKEVHMYSKNVWKVGGLLLLSLFIFISIAQAEPIDITYCLSMTTTLVSETQELSVHSFDFKGIARSNLESKAFDNLTFHGIGVARDLADKRIHRYGYIKFMDPDGDILVTENLHTLDAGQESDWNFLQGTGKWKGIKGGGKLRSAAGGKPITPGTRQGCMRMMGTFELPKK
jgi:hypothetical protein